MVGFLYKEKSMTSTVNEINLSYTPNKDYSDRYSISSSKQAFDLLVSVFDQNEINLREEFVIIYLNRANKVLGYCKAFKGGIGAVTVDIKMILGIALKGMASSIILAHNHPSGNRYPSQQDREMTIKVRVACEAMEINMADHLIVVPDGNYFSFADEGLI